MTHWSMSWSELQHMEAFQFPVGTGFHTWDINSMLVVLDYLRKIIRQSVRVFTIRIFLNTNIHIFSLFGWKQIGMECSIQL